jgi:endonuclease/exonuclease/phosphatase family metal-dependent hydrolase
VCLARGVAAEAIPDGESPDSNACFGTRAHGDADARIQWIRAPSRGERTQLDPWCAGVGPPAFHAPPGPVPRADGVGSLAIVVWNTNVGGASLAPLVADLRAGRLTAGRPVGHFALLIQEALRTGEAIPATLPSGARGASRILRSPADGPRLGVDEVAARLGLFAYYVPSMRNGPRVREDRGNAILSTLPLSDLVAFELPLERQRRVAIAATVTGAQGQGTPWSVRLVNVHLDNRSRWRAFHRSFGRGRSRQAERIVELFADDPAIVVGGDFNTWLGESQERAIELMHSGFPIPNAMAPVDTSALPAIFRDRQMDYLFFRLPEGWEAHYRALADKRGSDHAPLIGEVTFAGRGEVVPQR